MEVEIQFGEVEQTKPLVQLRPDRNRHYGVSAVYAPQEHDLPVFVDLDALREMEDHALSDTSVELGGVMLGGQYEDEHGQPFVLISDSLRAQHYEATKGSFKFTHDTWEKISRDRDEFPAELQIVGWYHTHPDWGVFLSGMDMFICDHFFNKTLDLALVIDPCRRDRGFFQWTSNPEQRVRRTDGFYLMASRFRQDELDEFATYLEGQFAMSGDPRFRSGYSGPVVHVDGTQANWQNVAVLGMLAMQFCFLMLIAWRLMLAPADTGVSPPAEELAAIQASIDRLSQVQQQQADVEAKTRILDGIVSQWPDTPEGLVGSLTEKESEIEQLRGNVRAHQAFEEKLDSQIKTTKSKLALAEYREESLKQQIDTLQEKMDQLQDREQEPKEEVDSLGNKLASDEADEGKGFLGSLHWTWIALGATLGALAVGGIVASVLHQKSNEDDYSDAEESSRETNKELARAQDRPETPE